MKGEEKRATGPAGDESDEREASESGEEEKSTQSDGADEILGREKGPSDKTSVHHACRDAIRVSR